MRHYIFLSTVLLALTLATSSPIDPDRRHVNRPAVHVYGARERRSDPNVKGGFAKVPLTRVDHPPETRLRKGEYMCGNQVCKLKPGEKPPCDVCQYRVL